MKPLAEFQGRWNGAMQVAQFTWDARALGTDGCIVIAGVIGDGANMQIDFSQYNVLEVRALPGNGNQFTKKIAVGQSGVYKLQFCGLSLPSARELHDDEMLDICRRDASCLTTVMMGKADITWSESVSVQDTVKLVTLDVTSSCEISGGVLGYQYAYGKGLIVKMPFPDRIRQGKQSFRPILIPRDCEIAVVPYDTQFNGNLKIKKRNKLFGF